ncbi:hypothetical protein QUB75_19670 [Microcoleus sp. K1-B6]|uniref:hypothetical protein n=1 Tax=Microcoleus sp. K1-B6 TaxID=2818787 RepID=UPI002FD857FC
MKSLVENASFVGTLLTSLVSLVVLWNVTRAVLTRLANIQRKITLLRSLFIGLRGELRALQKFLKINHGYHIREDIQDVQEDLLKQYDDNDTGF